MCRTQRPQSQRPSSGGGDEEDRVAGGDGQQLLVRGIVVDTLEEGADLELPPLQVGPEDGRLLLVGELDRD